jgi:FkbM family methyltransferase
MILDRLKTFFTLGQGGSGVAGDDGQEPSSPLQIYSGYRTEHADLILRHATETVTINEDHYVDGFGVKTLFACVPFLDPASLNFSRLKHPLPDDGFHAEGVEYAALLDAIERFAADGEFRVIEAGAGWAPWLAMAGVICRRRGVTKLGLCGIEASAERFALMERHLTFNDLDAKHGVEIRLFEGAVWSHDGVIYFPESAVTDMGAAASGGATETDYRGQPVSTREVPCTRLDALFETGTAVHFLHIDVQGAEFEVVSSHLPWLNQHVKAMMIATHSRPLEGSIMSLLGSSGWHLVMEKPCRFNTGNNGGAWEGCTTVDGSQYWVNSGL